MKKKKLNLNDVAWAIDNEGFDYCFRLYSGWGEVTDKKFHLLMDAYVKAADDLEKYVNDNSTQEEE